MNNAHLTSAAWRMADATVEEFRDFIGKLGRNAAGRLLEAIDAERPMIERHLASSSA